MSDVADEIINKLNPQRFKCIACRQWLNTLVKDKNSSVCVLCLKRLGGPGGYINYMENDK